MLFQFIGNFTFFRNFQSGLLNWGWWRIMTWLHVSLKSSSTYSISALQNEQLKLFIHLKWKISSKSLVTTFISVLLIVHFLFTVLSLPKKVRKIFHQRWKKVRNLSSRNLKMWKLEGITNSHWNIQKLGRKILSSKSKEL